MKRTIALILSALLIGSAGFAKDFPVADFGAKGDGKSDDGPAIQKAVHAALAEGAGSRVVFEQKPYRLDWRENVSYQISLAGAKEITLEGNGAVLVSHPRSNLISLTNCTGVSVKNFTVDYDPLPFTQGTITTLDAKKGWIDVRIQKGYTHPLEVYQSLGIKPPDKDWGVVFDPVARHRRWDVSMQFYMDGFERSPSGADTVRVMFSDESKRSLESLRAGDRYVITYKLGNSAANIQMTHSGECLLEDFTFHMAKYGMTFRVEKSEAQNIFRRVKIAFKPGSDRLIATPKDGFHCKGNRVGPLIEECYFEGLLDDSINISTCPSWIKEVISPGIYAVSRSEDAPLLAGDRLMALTPSRNECEEGLIVKSVKPYAKNPKWDLIELDRKIANPSINPTNNDFPGGKEKLNYTGLYNIDAAGANYIIRNCVFREQRRNAMLVRAHGGLIEGNTIDGVGGSGVYMTNEAGSFYEGPVPKDCIIRNNSIKNTQGTAIVIGSIRAADAKNIRITGNRIEGLSEPLIRAFSVSGLEISGNKFSLGPKTSADGVPWSLRNVFNEAISGNTKQ